jgi:HSP20 family protein
MALSRYEPGSLVSQLHDEINRVFTSLSSSDSSGATSTWVPAVDIVEFQDRFQLTVDLPGVDPDKVDITLENGVLSLAGEREPDSQSQDNSQEMIRFRNERGHGKFYRQFVLPETVDAERVNATGKNGVLSISIPKQAKALPRRIKVSG